VEEDTNPYSLQQTLPASLAHMNLCRLDSRVTDLITVRQKEMVEGGRFFFHLFFLVFFVFFLFEWRKQFRDQNIGKNHMHIAWIRMCTLWNGIILFFLRGITRVIISPKLFFSFNHLPSISFASVLMKWKTSPLLFFSYKVWVFVCLCV